MSLTDYPTPETDSIAETWYYIPHGESRLAVWILLESLEQRLTICRDVLSALNNSHILQPEIHTEISRILALTSPKP